MNVLQRLNRALDYVEDNLDGELDYSVAAKHACCSSYNFQRMFSFIAGISLVEYVRRRRMTLAGIALQQGEKVINVALRFGYDSPVSFARAFRETHGFSPSQARRSKANLKAYPRISFQITIKGETPMKYRIEDKPAFQIFGIEHIFPSNCENGEFPASPAELWQACFQDGRHDQLFQDAGENSGTAVGKVHGAMGYRDTGDDTFPYMLFAFAQPQSKTQGYATADIPAQTYAIFPSEPFEWPNVVETIHALYEQFYREWLPGSGYELANGMNFEIYGGDGEMGQIEMWYPIVKC
ncbi:MAG: AraC family transcriptional regulator [Oscillospiraceae bacterium]|nr:AraC family transcriptional regulator [Oscillospiraceae bacterium]